MRIVKELFRLAATVWLILLMAIVVDVMTETAEACGTPDCIPTNTPYPTGTLVPTEKPTKTEEDDPTRTPKPDDDDDDDDDDPTRTPKPTDDDPTRTPKPTKIREPSDTPRPTKTVEPDPTHTLEPTDAPEPTSTPDPTPEPAVTKRPYDCHKDGDRICESDLTATPAIVVKTSLPPTPTGVPTTLAPTETSMIQACPNICCCPAQVGSETIDYSEAILEFKPIAYILLGILGINTLLRAYGIFRKN